MYTQGDSPNLFITLDKPTYQEGSQVNGTIILHTMIPLYASYIKLIFNGEELVKFTKIVSNPRYQELTDEQKKTTNEPTVVPRHYKSKKSFYNTEQMIQRFPDDVIPPGQYQYPFSFLLGTHIPDTFEHFWKTEQYQNEAVITYSLTAKLTDRSSSVVGRESVKYLVIQNVNTDRMLEHKKIDQLHDVYNFCCAGKGRIRVVTYFEKDWYYNDEDAYIVCEIDNSESHMVIDKVFARLNQSLEVKAEGQKEEISKQIVGEQKEINLQPGKKMTGGNSLRLKIGLSQNGKGKTNTTVEGDLIRCSYNLSVTLSLSGCCASVPSHHLPIRIYGRPPAFIAAPQFGGNFSPQMYAPFAFTPERSGKFDNGASVNYPSMN